MLACSPSNAQSRPFIGTWTENCDKSVSTFSGCIHQTIRIEDAGGGNVRISDEFTQASGARGHTTGVHRLDGSEVHPTGNDGDSIQSIREITSNVWERIAKRSGDVRHGYWAVLRDGKMLIVTGFGTAQGREYYFHRILDRQ